MPRQRLHPARRRFLFRCLLGVGVAGAVAIVGAFAVAPSLRRAAPPARIPAVARLAPVGAHPDAARDPVAELCSRPHQAPGLGASSQALGLCALYGSPTSVARTAAGPVGQLRGVMRDVSETAGRRLLADQARRATSSATRLLAAATAEFS